MGEIEKIELTEEFTAMWREEQPLGCHVLFVSRKK